MTRNFTSLKRKATPMLTTCRVCSSRDLDLVHQTTLDHTLTTELKLRPGRLEIYLCTNCAHLMSDAGGLDDVKKYYEQEYEFLLEAAEFDDLYDVDADLQPIYRSRIQIENVTRLTNLPSQGRLLDFGCGKGKFLSRFHEQYPEWKLAGFDVSERYRVFAEPITGEGAFYVSGVNEIPPIQDRFDLITLFFVTEHLAEPQTVLTQVASLLKPNGFLYLTVPNVLSNSIDAFLSDHLSHFSALSLTFLLHRCGLRPIMISEHHQLGNITLMAAPEPNFKQLSAKRFRSDLVNAVADKVRNSIDYWVRCTKRLEQFLADRPSAQGSVAVYGAGVFGSYLAMHSGQYFKSIACFLDQNPFKTGKQLLQKPIVTPRDVPAEVSEVLVGLNPGRAREILGQTKLIERGDLRFFFP